MDRPDRDPGVVPAIDLFAGLDRSNPPDDVIERLEKDTYYRWITYAFLPIQYVGFVGAFVWIAKPEWLGVAELSTFDKIGIAISIGGIGGIGINTAHELGHKKESHERWLSKIALAQSFYGHFYIEHNRGHHVRVATPEDPASSRLGENFYQFWPRTVRGSLKSAWRLEKHRYARKGKHPFRIGNDVLNAWLMSAVLWGAMMAVLGWRSSRYLVIQAIIGFSLLEVVNYMEHYGMLRQKVGAGERQRYERVDPSHSWNSNNIATNVLLYHLQRHSDHHANPTRRYQTLRDFEESPVLPTGYAGMIVLAIVPPVWRRVMDPRVARPLRRRPDAGQHQPPQARQDHRQVLGGRGGRGEPLDTGHLVSRRSLALPPQPAKRTTRCSPPGAPAAATPTRWRAATSRRGSRPAPPGPTYPTRGAAPTAACARRSTSCRSRLSSIIWAGVVRIEVDRDKCEGLGMCEAMAHEYFEVDDDDLMTVLDEAPPESERSKVHAAVEACPVLALTLVD